MEKVDLTKQFSYRLRDALIAAGYQSERSTSGINIHKLAEITGHSTQICRKYLSGAALPEPAKLIEIATKLNVSPGWLLFGDNHESDGIRQKNITICRNLLHYIFKKTNALYNEQDRIDEIEDFLLELTSDVSQLSATEEQSKKIIDIALSSIKRFTSRK